MVRNEIVKRREVVDKEYYSTAWCRCGDSLHCIELLDKDDMIQDHEYYCIGCDATYKLVEQNKGA